MKAILVREFGGPEVLKLEEVPTPKPQPNQVLVKIHAAGVNPYDTYMRNGTYAIKPPLPYTPGSDAAGVVEGVGNGITKVKPGDRVYTARTVTGAYAEYVLALEDLIGPIQPRSMSCAASRNAVHWRRCSFSSPPGRSSGRPGACARTTARFRSLRSTAIRCGTWLASLPPAARCRRKSLTA